jgi:hypothetical protein
MTIPTDRPSFSAFCLRKLGAPVLQINCSEEQIDDCIDQSLYYYAMFHMDGSEKTYYKYQMTNTDITNGYITLPNNIIGAVKIFPIGQSIGTNSLFNMRYQFVLNDLYNFSNVSLVPYYMVMNHIQFIEEMLIGQKPIRFNRHNHILYLDMDMSVVEEGQWLIAECYGILDPTIYTDMWSDKYLQDYTIAQIKKQWGTNLSKFDAPLPGGIKLNGQKIYDDAVRDIERLENLMISTYSLPASVFVG